MVGRCKSQAENNFIKRKKEIFLFPTRKIFKSAGDDTKNVYRNLRNNKIANQTLVNSAGKTIQITANELLK